MDVIYHPEYDLENVQRAINKLEGVKIILLDGVFNTNLLLLIKTRLHEITDIIRRVDEHIYEVREC
jgi:hypothetical protein